MAQLSISGRNRPMSVLVTGAAGGIGSAVATVFEAAGYRVFRHDARPDVNMTIVGNLLDATTLTAVTNLVSEEGISMIVAAHGIAGPGALDTISTEFLERIIDINTRSVIALYGETAPYLSGRGGSFIVVSSQAGLVGEAGNAVYSASKFALVGWARSISRSAGSPRIRVVCPGMTETPLLVKAFEGNAADLGITYEEVLADRMKKVPGGRLGRPSEIGRTALWLSELLTSACVVAPVTGGEVLR
ncbi:SDR family oxidoreductase [Glaciihabitans sp. UYNi722]|uniref:SDR family NAD(P)-dependent oxidoreductase n=1 Tax=Glaciihabitans sp. UYNi722 TaxID=3156344 RepID=UPI003395EBE2